MTYRGGGKAGNKNAEKWTEQKALDIAHGLIIWLNKKPTIRKRNISKINLFIIDYLAENGFAKELIRDLSKKYKSFYKLIQKAKTIQEAKLLKYSIVGKLNTRITEFCLKNHHNYKDRQDITSDDEKIDNKIQVEIVRKK